MTEQGTTRVPARVLAVALGVLAWSLLVGCGSDESSNTTAASPSASPSSAATQAHHRHHHPDCLSGLPHHDLKVGGKRALDLRLVGHGHVAVVLSNQSNVDLCAWQGEAARLHRRGYLVALYDYTSGTAHDLTEVVRYLRYHGVSDIALMGASLGATTSVVVAGHGSPDALITLSADYTGRPQHASRKTPTQHHRSTGKHQEHAISATRLQDAYAVLDAPGWTAPGPQPFVLDEKWVRSGTSGC